MSRRNSLRQLWMTFPNTLFFQEFYIVLMLIYTQFIMLIGINQVDALVTPVTINSIIESPYFFKPLISSGLAKKRRAPLVIIPMILCPVFSQSKFSRKNQNLPHALNS